MLCGHRDLLDQQRSTNKNMHPAVCPVRQIMSYLTSLGEVISMLRPDYIKAGRTRNLSNTMAKASDQHFDALFRVETVRNTAADVHVTVSGNVEVFCSTATRCIKFQVEA